LVCSPWWCNDWYADLGGVMIGMLTFSVVDHGFDPQSNQRIKKDFFFSAKHDALSINSKELLDQNLDSF
jgi:hypothetical protein